MSTYTVTINVADFVSNGVAPRLAFVTFSRLAVDDSTGEIISTGSTSVRITQSPVTIVLEQSVVYKIEPSGVPGFGTFYASATADLTLAAMRDSHQVDPTTLQPIDRVVTVAEAIAAAQSAAVAAAAADAASRYAPNADLSPSLALLFENGLV